MKRSVLGAIALALLLASVGLAFVGPFNNPVTHAASTLQFEAKFETANDFFGRFDYGYSGLSPFQPAGSSISQWKGDHDLACNGPTTSRDVALGGTAQNVDFSQLFWYCAPGGDGTKGHVMTALDTTGYNIVWFSPKPQFSSVSQVCWDINETMMSRRKWTQVVFVSAADAVRFPTGSVTNGNGFQSFARGTGGFDLGFPNPDHRTNSADPSTGIDPLSPIAGFQELDGSANWFQDSSWTSQFVGPYAADRDQTTDKAARFTHCLTNGPNNTVILTKATPTSGTVTRTLTGQIPQGPIRVVFQDDEYDGVKDDRFSPNVLTWHWDNIQVFTGDGATPPTTAPTTVAPTTVATTAAPTTVAPTTAATTVAPTTVATTAASTTVAGTVAPTTVATTAAPTTVGPIDLTAAPTTAASTTAAPTTVAPTTAAPTTVATTVAPTTAAPTTAAPTTVATTVAPTTAAPTTAAPTTAAPTTLAAPTTVATTAAPTTVATTVAPTTVAPTTAAPTTVATTVAPTTAAPTTVATTVAPTTAAPTTVATTVAPTTAAAPAAPTGDTTPPVITIMGGPPATTTDRNAVITFTATDGTQEFSGGAGGGVAFTASLDGGSASLVTSPVRIAGLPLGDHVLVIKATDQAGNVGSARVSWTVVPMPGDLTARGGSARGSSAPPVIVTHKSALEAAIKGGGLRAPFRLVTPKIRVADNVVVRTAVPTPAQEVLAQTGARTMENVVLGLTLIGLGLVLAGVASGFRRRTS